MRRARPSGAECVRVCVLVRASVRGVCGAQEEVPLSPLTRSRRCNSEAPPAAMKRSWLGGQPPGGGGVGGDAARVCSCVQMHACGCGRQAGASARRGGGRQLRARAGELLKHRMQGWQSCTANVPDNMHAFEHSGSSACVRVCARVRACFLPLAAACRRSVCRTCQRGASHEGGAHHGHVAKLESLCA